MHLDKAFKNSFFPHRGPAVERTKAMLTDCSEGVITGLFSLSETLTEAEHLDM